MPAAVPLTGWTLQVDPDGPAALPPPAAALLGRDIPATIPGGVHGDLQDAGLIPDPLQDRNERALGWVSHTDWVYRCTLPEAPAAERTDLVFEGLDTVARIVLDGTQIGRSRNMHRSYRYDVTELLAARGPRDLAVHLSSPYVEAEALRARVGPRPSAYPEPFHFLRKMACSFGWDWGPTVAGAGIWRPAWLQAWSCARIAGVRALTDLRADGTGELTVHVDVERAASGVGVPLRAEVLLDGTGVASTDIGAGQDSVTVQAEVPRARVWHPVGYGEPERYRLEVRLLEAGGAAVDSDQRRIGFRRLQLDRDPDREGTPFTFHLNDSPVLVKGVNWIPGDVLPGRITRKRYELLLRRARDAGVNLVRVWGGGLYETDEFYDLCDELGLLVWQDFPFACAAYPEEEPLRGEILAEAAENVARLCSHPSLVLWCGNNENLWLHEAERWAARPGGHLSWGERYYLDDLPRIVASVDPSRPYLAGTPWSGSREYEPNDPAHLTYHCWDVWNRLDYTHYRDSVPRFVAEFGWQAPAAWRTLRDAVPDDPMTPDCPGVTHHQKAADGQGKLRRGLASHAPVPEDFDAWHYLMQWNQVRAIETGVLHWRAHWPRTSGTILWQLNDLWPALSWAAIDSAGRCKPLYHALRELYAQRALTFQPGGDGPELCVLNDSPEEWVGEAVLRRVSDDGAEVAVTSIAVSAAPRAVARVPIPVGLTSGGDPAREVLVADLPGARALWYAREPRETAFTGAAPRIDVAVTVDGLAITVTATSLLRDLLVQPDRMHPGASADRGFLTLLPGESTTVTVRCPQALSPDAVTAPWAIAWLDGVLAGR